METLRRPKQSFKNFHQLQERIVAKTNEKKENEQPLLPEGQKFSFGYQLLQASLLSNIVYPVYTQSEYIRHFTPGKNWNSLYTWDNGFIALGLVDVDPIKAFECVRAYTTEVGGAIGIYSSWDTPAHPVFCPQ